MSSNVTPDSAHLNSSAGHLSVHVGGSNPDDFPFLFEQQRKRLPFAFLTSFGLDIAIVAMLVFAGRYGLLPGKMDNSAADQPPSNQIIWLAQPGPGGGGGGGGNQMKEPPRKAELPGKDKITVPVEKPPSVQPLQQAKAEPNPVEQLNIPAKLLASSTDSLPGVVEAAPSAPSLSQGSGSGGGAGTGRGSGIGPGTGSGLGPGSGGGTGGGVYRPGSGVTTPDVLVKGKPQYTAEAMRARIQGAVTVQCVVQPSGVCTDIEIVHSLDPTFGLDEEAIKSVRQWRFKPGTRLGQPVPVLVVIEVAFSLR
jgi:TonB family protein